MDNHKGNQYQKPEKKPSEEHVEDHNNIKETSRDEIAGGAGREDQLEKLQPGPETVRKQESQSPPHIDDGSKQD